MVIKQADYWNREDIVEEFSNYQVPEYWQQALSQHLVPGATVLDSGSGGGRNSVAAYNLGYEVYATDAHEQMVKATKQKLLLAGMDASILDQRVTQSQFSNLPYPGEYFNLVISSGVLHNCDSIGEFAKGIEQIARVLKPLGHLYLNVFIQGREKNNLVPTEQDCVFLNSYGLPVLLLSKENLLELLANHGLMPVDQIYCYTSKINEGERQVLRGVFVLTR